MALAGSQPAYQEIVRRYERPVFNLIARIVRDSTLAEDVAQVAFVKAFRSLAGFDTARRFSSWIFANGPPGSRYRHDFFRSASC